MSSSSPRRTPDPEGGSTWRSLAFAVLGGAAWGLCQGRATLPLLGAAALVPMMMLLDRRRPALFGWLFGTVAWGVSLPWIVPTLTTYGFIPGWLAGLALFALAAFLGLYGAAFAGLGARLWRSGDVLSLVALPALWVSLEVLRGHLLTGFPWNLAAYAWVALPGALPLAAWIGAWGVSGVVVAVNLGLARAWRRRKWEGAVATVLLAATLLAISARFSHPNHPRGPLRPVRLVQPDIPDRAVFDAAANEADYQRLLAMTRRVCTPGALVLWPESATWPREWQDDPRLDDDVHALTRQGCAVLLNSAYHRGGKYYNAVLLVEPQAAGHDVQVVAKRHLVPFGEYVPFRRELPFLGKIARTVGDFAPAERTELLSWNGERLGAAVCYEVIFPGEVTDLVAHGATVLFTVTNDGWYGDTAAPRQHLRAARFRAAENGRWMLRAAVTGISAAIRPDGSIAGELGVGRTGTISIDIAGHAARSPYSRLPWLVPAFCVALAAAAIVRAHRVRGAP